MATEGYKRKISAILSADAVGYSRLMEEDEVATIRTIESYRKIISALIRQHNGRVVDSPGDNLLSEFGNLVDAVQCAVEIQQVIKAKNTDLPEARIMEFRIGINLGDVIEEGGRIYGESINIAARIEGISDPGGICISGSAYEQIESKLALGYENLGEYTVKNISRPIQVYRIPMELLHVAESGTDEVVSPPEKPSIAILPFENMSSDPEQDYFSDGMAEGIITRLSKNSRLIVRTRNLTFHYRGKPVKIESVSQELDVRYVVEGSVQKDGNRILITPRLIDATTGNCIWAKTYDRGLKEIFFLQDDITQQIAASVGAGGMVTGLSRVRRIPTQNLKAIDYFWRARELYFRRNRKANAKAREFCEKAIDFDPNLTEAYEMMGATHLMDYLSGWDRKPQDALDRVYEFAQKALSLDTYSAGAHDLLAFIYAFRNQKNRAIAAVERAIAIDPNADNLYADMAHILTLLGRHEEAIGFVKKAMRLNPHYPAGYALLLGKAYLTRGSYKEALASMEEALDRNPDNIEACADLAMNYRMAWETTENQDPLILDRALEMAEKSVAIDDSFLGGHFELSLVYLLKKQHDQAIAEAEKLITYAPENANNYALQAVIFNYLGRPGEAIEMVEKAMQLAPVFPAWYFHTLGFSYSLSGRPAEAAAIYKRVFEHNPSHYDATCARLGLAILYDESGQNEEAQAEAAELLKLVPNFSVKVWGQRNPNKDQAQIERYKVALHKVGLK